MSTRTLLVGVFVALMGLTVVSRADACVKCKFDVNCTMYGQECTYQEYCAAYAAPRAGAAYCDWTGGICNEGPSCYWASNRPSLDPATTALRELLGLTGRCPLEVLIG
jgi:hypothetical protein